MDNTYIDVHCHLTGDEYDELGGADKVIQDAREDGVVRIICSGYDLNSSIVAKNLAEKHEDVYFSAGFHPSELFKYKDGDLEKLRALCGHSKCVAVGEIGLDYHFDDNPPKEMQREFFVNQLHLANELALPVVLHSRDACAETLEILRKNTALLKVGGLMHCYSYSAESVRDFAELGFYFSFGGPCTFKNAKKVYDSVQHVPAHRILTETDCPYLTPVPFRGTFPNQPKHVKHVLSAMAELRNENKEELEKRVLENAKTLFFKLK